MNILSIHSWVGYGHVGNAAAVFPLQRLGSEVWAVHTVQYSNHPGYGAFAGRVTEPAELDAVLAGIEARGAFPRCDGVLSGYAPGAETVGAIARTVARVRAANPSVLYCCDPVLGDAGRLYIPEPAAAAVRAEAIPAADLATPNAFELSSLTGRGTGNLAEVRTAATLLSSRMRTDGPRTVLVTGLRTEATPTGMLDMLAIEGDAAFLLRTPELPLAANGAGDALAALFLFHRIATGNARTALERAASSVFGILRRTAEAGARELLLVEAQEEVVTPSTRFSAFQL